jgi:spermidine synthase
LGFKLGSKWFIEVQSPHSLQLYEVKRILYSGRTKYQSIELLETYEYGKILVLDGKIQSSTVDEHIYHECLIHPALLAHPKPEKVLLIGGGEGAALREILKHKTVKRSVMVDLDEDVVKVSKELLPELHQGAFEDDRVELIIGEGRKFVETSSERFDVVIIDATDPVKRGPSASLYTREFYGNVDDVLTEEGLMVTQATSPYHNRRQFSTIFSTVASVFPVTRAHQVWVPVYNTVWGFVTGSKKHDPSSLSPSDVERKLVERGVRELGFYNPRMHTVIFTLSKDLEEELSKPAKISTDAEPVALPV